MSDYKGMFSPDDLRSLATGLENANSSAEYVSTFLYEAWQEEKKRRDLLEALEMMVAECSDDHWAPHVAAAREAIAKATGADHERN